MTITTQFDEGQWVYAANLNTTLSGTVDVIHITVINGTTTITYLVKNNTFNESEVSDTKEGLKTIVSTQINDLADAQVSEKETEIDNLPTS
jgi:hypothetical protein